MLDNKGFTLVELLAVIAMLGIFMMVTIPNIMGISEANKKQAYADDALKFKNTVEYMIRSDEDYIKPTSSNGCVVVSLTHLVVNTGTGFKESGATVSYTSVTVDGTDYDAAPYDGIYNPELSYVVIKKNSNNEYEYYVQLLENLPDSGYRGIKLNKHSDLEGSGYLDKINDVSSDTNIFYDGSSLSTANSVKTRVKYNGSQLCNAVDAFYYANARVVGSTPTYSF